MVLVSLVPNRCTKIVDMEYAKWALTETSKSVATFLTAMVQHNKHITQQNCDARGNKRKQSHPLWLIPLTVTGTQLISSGQANSQVLSGTQCHKPRLSSLTTQLDLQMLLLLGLLRVETSAQLGCEVAAEIRSKVPILATQCNESISKDYNWDHTQMCKLVACGT